jgi:hypothetical protein
VPGALTRVRVPPLLGAQDTVENRPPRKTALLVTPMFETGLSELLKVATFVGRASSLQLLSTTTSTVSE